MTVSITNCWHLLLDSFLMHLCWGHYLLPSSILVWIFAKWQLPTGSLNLCFTLPVPFMSHCRSTTRKYHTFYEFGTDFSFNHARTSLWLQDTAILSPAFYCWPKVLPCLVRIHGVASCLDQPNANYLILCFCAWWARHRVNEQFKQRSVSTKPNIIVKLYWKHVLFFKLPTQWMSDPYRDYYWLAILWSCYNTPPKHCTRSQQKAKSARII